MYAQDEAPCPLCKAPSNILLPCFRRVVFESISGANPAHNELVQQAQLADFIDIFTSLLFNKKPESKIFDERIVDKQVLDVVTQDNETI